MILDEILRKKRERLRRTKAEVTPARIRQMAGKAPPPRNVVERLLRSERISLIAEVKRASPSAGVIRPGFDPEAIVREYEAAGADALSILTEEDFFGGSLSALSLARAVCGLPVLRKDFLFDDYQVYEARAAGADMVLLIACVLDNDAFGSLYRLALDLGMLPLVEVHGEEDLERALSLDPLLLGINNRDLRTLRVDAGTTERLLERIPPGIAVVSESGIRTREDVEGIEKLGVKALLIGETFMRSDSIREKVRELFPWKEGEDDLD